jgi:hypothetical protein
MSRTRTPGLMDESNWTFISAWMADCLRHRLRQILVVEPIPRGILQAARDLLRLAVQAVDSIEKETVPTNPVGAASVYAFTTRAIRYVDRTGPHAEEHCNRRIRRFAEIVGGLDDGAEAESSEPTRGEIGSLADFFEQIALRGEAISASERRSRMGI